MKIYIKEIIMMTLLVVSFIACSEDDKIDTLSSVGGSTYPLDSPDISRLDNNYTIALAVNTKKGVTATKIEIYQNIAGSESDPIKLGGKISDATISSDGKEATFNTSVLGSFDQFPEEDEEGEITYVGTTGIFPLAIVTTFSDGTTVAIPYNLTVGNGIIETSEVTSIKYLDSTTVKVKYETVKKETTVIDNVKMQWKKNEAGTYSTAVDYPKEKGEINLGKIDYTAMNLNIEDTLYYKFTVHSGTQIDSFTTAIAIETQNFEASNKGQLSDDITMSKFSFATGKNYTVNSEIGEIVFDATSGFGFEKAGTTRIEFIENSGLNYNTADLFEAQTAFNAGTPVTSVPYVTVDDVVLYKITRSINFGTEDKPKLKDVTHYGLLKVTALSLSTTAFIQEFKFDYKEGELLLQP